MGSVIPTKVNGFAMDNIHELLWLVDYGKISIVLINFVKKIFFRDE